MSLKNKHIILGITGSIAAYKSAILTRALIKKGAEVQVIMTVAAKEFITPVTMSALTGKPVISDFFTANDGTWHSHVDLGLWADAMIVAPATASTIGKMANGIADNMLITTYLSSKAPVFVAPAMDLDMFKHNTTKRNLKILENDRVTIIEPTVGELASHLEGKGRMEEPEEIVAILETFFSEKKILKGKKIVITAGPTYEKIDPVRFIGNFSSGKMGIALADLFADLGAEVTLILGPTAITPQNLNIKLIRVESADEMYEATIATFPNADIAVLAAAVADYKPEIAQSEKIKHEKNKNLSLSLVSNPDIAASLGKIKREEQILVGFALETNNEIENATAKIKHKNLDYIVLNSLKERGAGFGVDTNKVTILSKSGDKKSFELKSKAEVAGDIIQHILPDLFQK